MENFKKLKVSVIGAGRLGTTVALALSKKKSEGFHLASVSSRTRKSMNRARGIIEEGNDKIFFTTDNIKAAEKANCILIATPDDEIEKVCRELTGGLLIKKRSHIFIHFSGSKSLSVLESARRSGALTASIHPLKSFASVGESTETLPGTVFGITCAGSMEKEIARMIVDKLEGVGIEVDDEKKPLYHAAACVASNYLVALIDYAVSIHQKIGINPGDSLKGLGSLIDGTIKNIKKIGTRKSLTGPIARGDTGTIEEHMDNFKKYFKKEDTETYRSMGKQTAELAYKNGWIDKGTLDRLVEILKNR